MLEGSTDDLRHIYLRLYRTRCAISVPFVPHAQMLLHDSTEASSVGHEEDQVTVSSIGHRWNELISPSIVADVHRKKNTGLQVTRLKQIGGHMPQIDFGPVGNENDLASKP